jgi:hypothetical protein
VGASATGEIKSEGALRQGLGWAREQHNNFQGGTVEWAKGQAKPALHAAQHPFETLQASAQLSTNIALNPPAALALGVIQGKPLDQVAREDFGEVKSIVGSTAGDYQNVYREHGVAGVAGYVLPDLTIAILTSGESTAAGASGRQIAKEVASSAVPIPGPEDLPGAVDAVRTENAKN